MITGLRRSCIFVPGDSERMLAKSPTIPADVLLLNLEDGVSASMKDAARANVVRALRSLDFGNREVVVRVNSLVPGTGIQDLQQVVPARPDGVCIPKVESIETVREAEELLAALEKNSRIDPGTLKLHAMIETSRGVLRAAEIAAASGRMATLIFGSADYAKDIGCRPGEDRAELFMALQMIVTAARAGGIEAIDAPCFDIRNLERLRRETQQAQRTGFDGKSALHPGQLPVINEIFDVSEDEVVWARRVIQELDEAEGRGRSLTMLDGQLIDDPHRLAAQRILRRASLTRGSPRER